jgi:hypothetical protein
MTKHELILKAVCALLLANITIAGFADSGPDVDPDEFLDMSLEELLDVRITLETAVEKCSTHWGGREV